MIGLQVRSGLGTVVARAGCGLVWSAELARLDRSAFPMLGHLSPFEDTVFNRRQVATLLDEVPRLPPGVLSEEFSSELRALCRMVLDESHRYLWFVGD